MRVYKVNGTNNGSNTFDLNDWKTGSGGEWQSWHIDNGVLVEASGSEINCSALSIVDNEDLMLQVFPNPATTDVKVNASNRIQAIRLFNLKGELIIGLTELNFYECSMEVRAVPSGMYILEVMFGSSVLKRQLLEVD